MFCLTNIKKEHYRLSVFRGPAWEWSELRGQFYYHAFTKYLGGGGGFGEKFPAVTKYFLGGEFFTMFWTPLTIIFHFFSKPLPWLILLYFFAIISTQGTAWPELLEPSDCSRNARHPSVLDGQVYIINNSPRSITSASLLSGGWMASGWTLCLSFLRIFNSGMNQSPAKQT